MVQSIMLDQWRVSRELRHKYRPNIVSLRGGAWLVPDDAYWLVLERIFFNCESHRMYYSEVANPDKTKLFFDIDLVMERREEHLRLVVESMVNSWFFDCHRAVFKWRDGSHGCHIIFPTVVTTGAIRKTLTQRLAQVIPETDCGVTGLRLPGCWGKSTDKAPYFPLTADASIHCTAKDEMSPMISRKLFGMPSLAEPQKLLENVQMYDTDPRTVVEDSKLRKMQKYINNLHPEWKCLRVHSGRQWRSIDSYMVKGPGATYCKMHGGFHKSNRIFFEHMEYGQVRQKCFKCRGQFIQFDGYLK